MFGESESDRCPTHRRYRGAGRPRSTCEACWRIWVHLNPDRSRATPVLLTDAQLRALDDVLDDTEHKIMPERRSDLMVARAKIRVAVHAADRRSMDRQEAAIIASERAARKTRRRP